ncbi:MAG: sensor domain-containing diguanylate cyclase [Anaerolineae bacterium]|nr:sensor domain-containing diguanylate cyclase [Anaerolineae bacterium]
MGIQSQGQMLSQGQLLKIINIQTQVVQQGLDLSSIMFLVAKESQELTGADGAVVELAEDGDMVYRAATGTAENQLGLRLPINTSLSGLCVKLGETLICDDSETDPRVDREACRKVGLRSMVVNPLKFNGKTVGVLKLICKKTGAFGENEVQIVNLLSDLIAASMYMAVEYEEKELYVKATTDSLTGISNRALFYDRLRLVLSQSQRKQEGFGVVLYDMDGLKRINDILGHRAGDSAIKEVAHRARAQLRDFDTISRLGGDEFGIILNSVSTKKDIDNFCDRVSSAIQNNFIFEDQQIKLSVSMGYSLYSEDGREINQLIETADQNMYVEKRNKKMRSSITEI